MKFYHEINTLKSILYKNRYPRDIIYIRIKEFFGKSIMPKIVVSTVPERDLIVVLPYLGKLRLQIRIRITRVMKNKLPYRNLRIVFQTKRKLINSFLFKGKIPVFLRSDIVYKLKCGGCSATCYGKTKRHFKFRMCEQLGVLLLL